MPQRGGLIICLLLKFSSSGFKVVEGRLFTATVESERGRGGISLAHSPKKLLPTEVNSSFKYG